MMIWSKEREVVNRGNAEDEIQNGVRDVLKKFQNGYSGRDENAINDFMNELFTEDSDSMVIGTADSEWCLGREEIGNIILADWKYWGNLVLDIDGATVSSHGEVAWVSTEGVIRRTKTAEQTYEQYLRTIQDGLSCQSAAKDKLVDAMKQISICMHEVNLGEDIIRPFRFTAVLVKTDEKWKFHNIHYSHPTTLAPDVRIVGDNKIS